MIKKFVLYYFFLFLFGCTNSIEKEKDIVEIMNSQINISDLDWNKLTSKKIYFGHQSVGYNMVDGMEMILKENPNIKLNIKKGNNINLFDKPVFAHDNNGTNRDPKSKIDAFYNLMEQGLGDQVDIAGFKFCYVDFNERPNYLEVFNHYKKRINEISIKYPEVKIIHFTVPIMSLRSGPKALIKNIFRKNPRIRDNNVINEFNELLRKEYKDQLIFDLEYFESTYPDGTREFQESNGKIVYNMIPAYTYDGGHLSNKGKITVSSQFFIFLTQLTNDRNN